MKKLPWLVYFGYILLLACFSCSPANEYYRTEERELNSNERFDSLFLGFYLGMPAQAFYEHCWDLNQQGLFRQGAGNASVHYEINDFNHQAGMDFYPKFHEDKIIEMPLTFTYKAWSPWNKELFSENLIKEVVPFIENWFGTGFIQIQSPKKYVSDAFVKIDGNRRISIYAPDDSRVQVDIVDLRLIKSLEKKHQ